MKIKTFLLPALLMLAVLPSRAQQRKISFHSINTFEIISGQSPLSTGFQSVEGFRFSSWFTGIGTGIDHYSYPTLPLFLDFRRSFGREKRAFGYGDIGYDFPWKDKPGKEIPYNNSPYHFSGGIYSDLGMAYEFRLSNKSAVLFSLGYSYKELKSKIDGTNLISFCPFGGCPFDSHQYQLSFGRLILKAGLVL